MKRVLVLGNNTRDTDDQTTRLAQESGTINHGLISDINQDLSQAGYYHTTITDISGGDIINVAKDFDEVIMLDQPKESWDSTKPFLSTLKIMITVDRSSNQWATKSTYKDNKNIKWLSEWIDYFKQNQSFCMYPWVSFNDQYGYMTPCNRSNKKIRELGDIDWKNDPQYKSIRKKMLSGEKMPDMCKTCYQYQDRGMDSYRVHDSLDFIVDLGIESIDDLNKIDNPYYYELRLGNTCNLMCRMCIPSFSHLIEREFTEYPELQIENSPQVLGSRVYSESTDVINVESLTKDHLVYLSGGEPTVMPEVYKFMRECIAMNKTDFKLTLGTNAQNLNKTFMELASHFSQMHFSVSVDGYGKVNDYIRWNSDWDTLVKNCYMIKSEGHQFTWNHVPTIWGIHRTHEFFEWASTEFPMEQLYLQYNYVDLHSAFKSPLVDETLESLERTKKTRLYHSDGKDCTSGIDAIYEHYETYKPDLVHLRKFFTWNDTMDRARNIQMKDYLPELDSARSLFE